MSGWVRPAPTLEQIERRSDSAQTRPRPVTDTARRESSLVPWPGFGSWDCWCGQRNGHDWPGKDAGAPHPRETGRDR